MKRIKILKVLSLCGLFFSAHLAIATSTPKTNTVNAASTEKTIKEYFKFPQVLLPRHEEKVSLNKVEVVFTTNDFGKVDFVLAKTENKILKTEIEKQFLELVLPNIKQNVAHSVVLNFRTL